MHLGEVKELFPYVQFTCAADGDDSIALAQHARSTLPENDREVQMLMPCDAHLKCTNRVATFSLDKELNSYFTHVTLSLRFGNNLRIFRRSVDLVLDEAMTGEREQQPSTLARSRNEKLLNDLVLDRPGSSMVRWLLLTYFLDDWARVGRFKIFLARIEEGLSDEKVLKRAKRIFKACLVRRGPRSFPGRSWTLADEGPAWCCCLLGFHGMFLPFYRVFCYLLSADDLDAPLPPGIILLDGATSVGPT